MDFGGEDQDDGDEREAGEVVDDDDDIDMDKENKDKENKDKDNGKQETEKVEPEPKKRKERIVKVEEGRRKIKINRQSLDQEETKSDVKMEVEQGRYQGAPHIYKTIKKSFQSLVLCTLTQCLKVVIIFFDDGYPLCMVSVHVQC
jgi:hypothetical protein